MKYLNPEDVPGEKVVSVLWQGDSGPRLTDHKLFRTVQQADDSARNFYTGRCGSISLQEFLDAGEQRLYRFVLGGIAGFLLEIQSLVSGVWSVQKFCLPLQVIGSNSMKGSRT